MDVEARLFWLYEKYCTNARVLQVAQMPPSPLASPSTPAPFTFLGIDGGGSSTRAVLLSSTGFILHTLTTATSNPHAADLPTVLARLQRLLTDLLSTQHPSPRVATLALSGLESTCLGPITRTARAALPATTVLHVVHDSLAPLGLLPARDGACAVLIAGTGSVAAVFDVKHTEHARPIEPPSQTEEGTTDATVAAAGASMCIRQTARRGGWGHLLGDEGSACAIARAVLSASLVAIDVSVPPPTAAATALSAAADAFVGEGHALSISQAADVVVRAVHAAEGREKVAALAALFAELALDGNSICNEAFRAAATDLADLLVAALRRAAAHGRVCAVLTGGVFRAWNVPGFAECFCSKVEAVTKMEDYHVNLQMLGEKIEAAAVGAARLGAVLEGFDNEQLGSAVSQYVSTVGLRRDTGSGG